MTLYSNFTIDNELKDVLIERGFSIPTYNFFDDPEAIKVTNKSIITNELIPVEEIKIVVNKESYTQHVSEWMPIYVDHYERLGWGKELAINHLHGFTRKKLMEKCTKILMEDLTDEENEIRKKIGG